ncbi:MAG: molybdopterin molybdotransferase MoeA, partial [Desulfobacterales bacterium]|nr:molybdopterin molybdotransferase MoeA [Desulfobacterales bacterium]
VAMGESPDFSVGPGEAARIATGGVLPGGADSVVMVEHAETMDETTLEVYRSVAPGQNMVEAGEDVKKGETALPAGSMPRFQETGLLAAMGRTMVSVYKKPIVGIISTGDEIVPADQTPGPGQIRDVNTYTLSGQVKAAGGIPFSHGVVGDDRDALFEKCSRALDASDMVLISGGSSVGMRDFTVEILNKLPNSEILVHGVSISPGKPTILARVGNKAFWGMPGHVVSAMVVFAVLVRPFIMHAGGVDPGWAARKPVIKARLTRNIASSQGRVDYVRVRVFEKEGVLQAEPILGASALICTMVKADGLIAVDMHTEGLDKGTEVEVTPL